MPFFTKNNDFTLKGVETGHFNTTYKGVAAIKCPFDYVLYQMLLWEVKPDLVIEIGTNKGGSTLYLADLLELNGNGVVHTIDLPANKEDPSLLSHQRIHIYKEGFSKYDTSPLSDYEKILVIEDGSHLYEDTLNALNKFAPFVSKGSYFIAEDGIITELGKEKVFNGGPQKAVADFLKTHPHFIVDRKWCDFFGTNATFNVNGYLKRVG
ncbi:MAG: CmcI family methyltransferase [Bacteroidota bacterium]|nr:CmcI family methyltransferase [Bacteroidota bacterium]